MEKVLEELDGRRAAASPQALCERLCQRLDAGQLAQLRGALLQAARLDPDFPDARPPSRRTLKLPAASDTATLFELLQLGVLGARPTEGTPDDDEDAGLDCGDRPYTGRGHPARPLPPCQAFVPASRPNFLPGPGPGAMGRAASLDRLPALGSPRACEMQRTRFPTHPDSGPPSDSDSPPGGPLPRSGPFRQDAQAPGRRTVLLTHSFELPLAAPSPELDPRLAKHESLDDLQASTYFGPPRAQPGPRQSPWPAKSWSLNAEERPRPGPRAPTGPARAPPAPPQSPEQPRPRRTFRDAGTGGRAGSDTSSVGTQTDPAPEPRGDPPRPRERQARPPSGNSEAGSEAISDLFRFLDELSLSGSTGPPPSSRHASTGSLGPPGSSPEPPRGPGCDRELRASVCLLARRVGEVERRLDALAGVRREVAQVLGRLRGLDRGESAGVRPEPGPLAPEAPSEGSPRPHETGTPDLALDSEGPDWRHGGRVHTPAPRKSLPTRPAPHPLAAQPGDWHAGTCPPRPTREPRGPGDGKDWHRRSKEADRQWSTQPAQPQEPFLVQQVFSPHARSASLRVQLGGGPAYSDMRLMELAPVPQGPASWSLEEYARHTGDKAKLATLDLQTREALNPNHVEYWMEGVCTPGYDSLLKRKEAEFRRSKVCKMAALVAAAACTVVLVVVVPICTMKS